jgi:hypothetical protein
MKADRVERGAMAQARQGGKLVSRGSRSAHSAAGGAGAFSVRFRKVRKYQPH